MDIDREERLKQFKLDNVVARNEKDLGSGSYGFVMEMTYCGLKCAGKKIHPKLYHGIDIKDREQVITRYQEECLLLCSLSHPNIVQFIGITSERGNPLPILVMEFVPFTLSTLLEKEGILPEDISYGILVDVSMGLCYLHERTVVHRDLSANNILLTSEMKAKIADLGVAKILNATPAKSKCPGTPTYMPPEALVENPEYRTEIDVFSYGVLIIHVFCGQWPHPGVAKKPGKDRKLVAHSEYERRSKYVEMIGDKHPMIRLIQRCLSDIPSERPNTNVVLKYTQDIASQFPRQFENVLDARKHISSLACNLYRAEQEKLGYDILNAKFQRCKSEHSLLSKKLDDEKKRCSNKESEHHLTLKLKEEELQEKCSLLDIKELEIHGLKKTIQAYRTGEIKTKSSDHECDLTETMEAAAKNELDSLRTQIDSLHKQLDAKICEHLVRVRRMLATSKELLRNMKLELEIKKGCAINNLIAELEIKESDISNLRAHQERAQDYLMSKDKIFLKFKFKQCEDLPMAMSDLQCAVIDDHVYVGGGTGEDKSDHMAQSQVFEYTLVRKRWVLLAHNPARYFGLTNFMGKLVSVGGILTSNDITGNVSVFDFARKTWKDDKILPIPTKRFHPTIITCGKCLAVCGGVTHGGSTTDMVEVLVGEQWHRGPQLPYRICHAKHAIVDHSCYLLGGASSFSPLIPSTASISIPLSFLMSESCSQQAEFQPQQWEEHRKHVYNSFSYGNSQYCPAIANHGGILLIIGGWNEILWVPTTNVFAYSSEADMWVKVQELPEKLCSLAASTQLSNGAIMLVGGTDSKGKSARVFLMSRNF